MSRRTQNPFAAIFLILVLIAIALLFFGQGFELIGQALGEIGIGTLFLALAVLVGLIALMQRGR